jgi:alkanesulfonate monooxygenase SsuD/methylene tetrahydromethanopterin reductase-like flavin-dependent oxidoreductase (luciferase family)
MQTGLCIEGEALELLPRLSELAQHTERAGFDWLLLNPDGELSTCGVAPAVSLAAMAPGTRRLRLAAQVCLAGGPDPVRLAEDYATLDGLCQGRAALVAVPDAGPIDAAGRFAENLTLLRRLWTETQVSWSGRHRTPLRDVSIHPRPVQLPHPEIWVQSEGREDARSAAAELGLPLLLAAEAVDPSELAPEVHRYRREFREESPSGPPRLGLISSGPPLAEAAAGHWIRKLRQSLAPDLLLIRPGLLPDPAEGFRQLLESNLPALCRA